MQREHNSEFIAGQYLLCYMKKVVMFSFLLKNSCTHEVEI